MSPASSLSTPFAERAEAQLLYCLWAAGDLATLKRRLPAADEAMAPLARQFLAAVTLAKAGNAGEALKIARRIVQQQPAFQPARQLAYRLLQHQAAALAKRNDWEALSGLVVDAMAIQPDGADASKDFGKYRAAVPFAHLRTDRRGDAETLWEEQLAADPHDFQTLHNLALLSYWRLWEGTDAHPAAWSAAIAYWALLQNCDPFWTAWRKQRHEVWGFELSEADLTSLRTELLEERFAHPLQIRLDDARQDGKQDKARLYDDGLSNLLLEQRSARLWKQMLTQVIMRPLAELLPRGTQAAHSQLLSLPGGVLFFKRFDLTGHVVGFLATLETLADGAEAAADLRLVFADETLARALALIEDRDMPGEGLALLRSLNTKTQALPEARYLLATGLAAHARQLLAKGSYKEAVTDWKAALTAIDAMCKDGALKRPSDKVYCDRLRTLGAAVREQIVQAAQREAKHLRSANKVKEAVAALESALEFDTGGTLREHLCAFHCELGDELLGKEDFKGARACFERALGLKSDYLRAKHGIATTYNNEGCKERDVDRSITLFETALKYNPDSNMAKHNLAREYRSKAIQLFNALNQYNVRTGIDAPISYLERAAKLVGQELKAEALGAIRNMAALSDEKAKAAIARGNFQDEDLKRILDDLATMYNIQARLGRGY